METDFTNRTEGEVDMSEKLVNYIEIGSPSDYHKLNSPNLVEFDSVLYDDIVKACNDYVDRPHRDCASGDGFIWSSCQFGHECSEIWGDNFRPFNKHYDGNFDGEFSIHSVVNLNLNCKIFDRLLECEELICDLEKKTQEISGEPKYKHPNKVFRNSFISLTESICCYQSFLYQKSPEFDLLCTRTFLIKYSNSKDAIYFIGDFHNGSFSLSNRNSNWSVINSPDDFFKNISPFSRTPSKRRFALDLGRAKDERILDQSDEEIENKINKWIEEAKHTAQRLIEEDERIKNSLTTKIIKICDIVFTKICELVFVAAIPTILFVIVASFLDCRAQGN